jgi:glycosyltransferase involved in cell wall biosynthesis
MKQASIPILHRLDGLAWLHQKRMRSAKHFLQSEIRNYLIQAIHAYLATRIIYQSQFVAQWWKQAGWRQHPQAGAVIYNGVDTDRFRPISDNTARKVLLCVEGTLDYSPYAIDLLNALQQRLVAQSEFEALVLYGGFEDPANQYRLLPEIDYRGKVSREELPSIYRDAVYLSLDINAACPNTVVEALSCGIPVIGLDTGALQELVGEGGKVVPYGGDPWKLDAPRIENLIQAAQETLGQWADFSQKARARAEKLFDLSKIQEQYINEIKNILSN